MGTPLEGKACCLAKSNLVHWQGFKMMGITRALRRTLRYVDATSIISDPATAAAFAALPGSLLTVPGYFNTGVISAGAAFAGSGCALSSLSAESFDPHLTATLSPLVPTACCCWSALAEVIALSHVDRSAKCHATGGELLAFDHHFFSGFPVAERQGYFLEVPSCAYQRFCDGWQAGRFCPG